MFYFSSVSTKPCSSHPKFCFQILFLLEHTPVQRQHCDHLLGLVLKLGVTQRLLQLAVGFFYRCVIITCHKQPRAAPLLQHATGTPHFYRSYVWNAHTHTAHTCSASRLRSIQVFWPIWLAGPLLWSLASRTGFNCSVGSNHKRPPCLESHCFMGSWDFLCDRF